MRYARLPLRSCSVLSIFVLLFSVSVFAQQPRGTLRGLITDELGAVIVGASVTLTDASGVQKKTTTNGEGVYTFAGLALGTYKLQAMANGFTPSDEKDVEIKSGRQSVDVMLRVATIVDTVTVAQTPISTEAN